jgi:O-antigen/teichoic acid export membrane protein
MFLRGVLGYLPVQLVQAIAGFGAIVVFTRLLSPADYGTYALAFSTAALVQTLGLTWIEAALARFYVAERERGDLGALYGSLYRAFAVSAAAVLLLGALVLAVLPVTAPVRFAIGAGLISVIFRSLLKLAQERRRAAGEVKGFAVFDMVQTGGGFLLGALLAWAGFGGAAPLVAAGVASAACLIWALPSEAAMARRGRFDPERLKGYAAYGLPVSMSLVLSLALATTDRFVLAAFMDTSAVGAYHAGYSLSNRTLDILFLWLGMAGHPATVAALERGGLPALHATARQQASLMLLIAVPAAAGLALVSQPLAMLMVGPELAVQAARVTPWIALGALFSGLTTHYLHMSFTLSRKTRLQFLAVAIPAGLNLVLTLVLIPRFGLDGALWATAASYGVGLVSSFVLMRRALPLPVPWTTLGQVVAATALMAAVILCLPSQGGLVEILLKAGVGALVYALAALALDAGGSRSEGLGRAIRFARQRSAAQRSVA